MWVLAHIYGSKYAKQYPTAANKPNKHSGQGYHRKFATSHSHSSVMPVLGHAATQGD